VETVIFSGERGSVSLSRPERYRAAFLVFGGYMSLAGIESKEDRIARFRQLMIPGCPCIVCEAAFEEIQRLAARLRGSL
jgi:hypothetical protein